MAETWNKKEREKKKKQQKKDKAEKKKELKENKSGDSSLESMMAYLDENGNITSKPPDPRAKKAVINAEDMVISTPKAADIDPADLIRTGVITFFNFDKGFGFIKDKETQESIFVHANALRAPVKENDIVTFEVEKGPRGLNALNVSIQQP